ncbi:MAG: septation protein IspZ [Proteobacteria bacterium]|nr:septation protein IspZ [Pseudomonadota bacterium]
MKRKGTLVRLGVDFGAPAAFLVSYFLSRQLFPDAEEGAHVITATWWLVGGSAAALLLGVVAEKRVAPMPLIAGVAAIIFGGLTLILHDETWVKIKPTVLNLFFAGFLLGGWLLRKLPLKVVLGEVIQLPEPLWRTLSVRYGFFFLLMALLNEAVWRTQSTDTWALFRFPGLQLLSLAFSATQFPLILRGAKAMEAAAGSATDAGPPA